MVFLQKKKIKGKNYYYLVRTFRAEGRVIKKEKYIGKERPKDLKFRKLEFQEEIIDNIKDAFNKYWKQLPEHEREKFNEEFSIVFTYDTNAIEGSTLTLKETAELLRYNITPKKNFKDILEAKSHNKAFLKMLGYKGELSINALLRWHKDIFGQTKPDLAGKLRDYLVRVGDYIAPDWQDLDRLMGEFFEWHNKNKNMLHPVKLAALAHLKFAWIHPFGDGNGRISRLIMNFILHKNHYPLLDIPYKKRWDYYNAFKIYNRKKDESIFIKMIFDRYIAQNSKYITLKRITPKNPKSEE